MPTRAQKCGKSKKSGGNFQELGRGVADGVAAWSYRKGAGNIPAVSHPFFIVMKRNFGIDGRRFVIGEQMV